ncbi:MAG TPA: hypothetical protein VN455_11210 [Methanotrichaceae archaeon]|nr:hypothetical protein [Methanotrichaceae archaeon]
MNLNHIPELDMSLDELDAKLESLADRKLKLTEELLAVEGEIGTVLAICAAKAIRELEA